jgi:uncharacterized protein HemX
VPGPGDTEIVPVPSGRGPVGPSGPGVSRNARLLAGVLLLLAVVLGATNLWSSYVENHQFEQQFTAAQAQAAATQQKAAVAEVQALCKDLATMAAIAPPAGPPQTNPSRAYEQAEHRAWQGLFTSIRCPQ